MAFKNFAYSTVVTPPSPADSGTSVTVVDADVFPAPPFNATVWPATLQPLASNAEIVQVTAAAANTFTITREQEDSDARSIIAGDQIAATVTAKTLTDLVDADGAQTQTATVTTDANTFEVTHDFDLERAAAVSVIGTVLSVVADGETFGTGPTDIQSDTQSVRRGYYDGGTVFPSTLGEGQSLGLWLVDLPYPSVSATLPQVTHVIAGVTPRYLRVKVVVMDQDFNTYAGANHPTATYRIDIEYV